MKKTIFLVVSVLFSLLTACTAGGGLPVDQTVLLKDRIIYLPDGVTCSAEYRGKDGQIQIDSFEYVSDADGTVWYHYVDSASASGYVTVTNFQAQTGTSNFVDLAALQNCLQQYKDSWEFSEESFNPTNARTAAMQSAPEVIPTNQPNQTTEYWVYPSNGDPKPLGTDRDEAVRQVHLTFEGGRIVERKLSNGFVVNEQDAEYVAPVQVPKDKNGEPLRLPNAQTPYYVNDITQAAFATLEEALADANTRSESTRIFTYVRGENQGLAVEVPRFDGVPVLSADDTQVTVGPADIYYQVRLPVNGVSSSMDYSADNISRAQESICANPEGGSIIKMQRGNDVVPLVTLPPWMPDPALVAAFGGNMDDYCALYWVFRPDPAGPMHYFVDVQEARSAVETFGQGCNFPGGEIKPYKRGIPLPDTEAVKTEMVLPWVCPPGLPTDWYPTDVYAQRAGTFYPSVADAVQIDWKSWYLGTSRQEIVQWRRGVPLTDSAKVNWWVPWQWVSLAVFLVGLLFLLAVRFRALKAAYNRRLLGRNNPTSNARSIDHDIAVMKTIIDLGNAFFALLRFLIWAGVTIFVFS